MKGLFSKSKILIVVIGVLFLLSFNFFRKEIKNFFYKVSYPIQKVFWGTGDRISDFFEAISGINNLKEENEQLKLKIQELLAENVTLQELKKENETLRTALNLKLGEEFELELSQIVGKEISQDCLTINKGEVDGLVIDLPVINQHRVLVGKISEVYKNFSKVQLVTSKDASFDVEIFEKEIYGLVKGGGNFTLSLGFIPREQEIEIGDKIITTALGRNFPKELLVGEIREVKKSDIEPFQTAELVPAFEIDELDFLFVIKNFYSPKE